LRNDLVSFFCPLRYTTQDRLFALDFVLSLHSALVLRKEENGNNKKIKEAVLVCYV
jgi:hypothetical protein